jgi:hypothetical protein
MTRVVSEEGTQKAQGGLTVEYDGAIRASDSDRESVAEILREAYTDGRLDLEEFDERTTAVYAARTWGQLRELTRDLPAGVGLGRGSHELRAAGLSDPAALGGRPPAGRPLRGPVFVPFLPVVLLWVVLAGAIHASGVVVPAIILLFVCLRLARRHDHGSDHRPGGSPPRAGGGPA